MTTSIKLMIAGIIAIGIGIIVANMWVGAVNREVDLFALIQEKNKANQQVHDTMWKSIQQAGNIAEKEKEAMMAVVTSFMSARSGNTLDGRGSFMSMLQEAYPTNIPQLNYTKVMNVMEGKRAEFQRNMTELFDICREYTRLTQRIPTKWFVDARPDVTSMCKTVTSTRTQTSFSTGVDDNVDINW